MGETTYLCTYAYNRRTIGSFVSTLVVHEGVDFFQQKLSNTIRCVYAIAQNTCLTYIHLSLCLPDADNSYRHT